MRTRAEWAASRAKISAALQALRNVAVGSTLRVAWRVGMIPWKSGNEPSISWETSSTFLERKITCPRLGGKVSETDSSPSERARASSARARAGMMARIGPGTGLGRCA
jgi:hypothetical protein